MITAQSFSVRLVLSVLSVLSVLLNPPSARAEGIAKGPYLQNPKTDGITVCWVSDIETAGKVTYGPAGQKLKGVAKEAKPAIYHKVHIQGLKPYQVYTYEVECEGKKSGLNTFRTAATPEQPFKFAAYGDNRSQPLIHSAVIRQMLQFKPDFVLQSGDLVQNGEIQSLWDDEFWPTVLPLARETPMYPALGNHERKGAPYFKYFDVAEEYSFDYGNAHFVALNSNRPTSEHSAQEECLRKDLAAHKSAVWRIVFFHHTPYTCVAIENRRVSSLALRNRLEPIFKAGNVQLVISGHDHNYQHHLANGIHYIVSGGGGAPLYDVRLDTPFTKAAKKAHHHCEITVNGSSMNIRAIEPDGAVIEEFILVTNRAAQRVNEQSATHLR